MSGQQKHSTRPVKLRVHDTDLACTVRRVIGYEAYCACGVVFPTRKSWKEAQLDGRAHQEENHRP